MWTPTNNVNTSVIDIIQTRECVVTVVGTADNPVPSCNDNGDTSQTQTIANPLAADTADWTIWTPSNTDTDTSVIDIIQMRQCVVWSEAKSITRRQAVMLVAILVKLNLLLIHGSRYCGLECVDTIKY